MRPIGMLNAMSEFGVRTNLIHLLLDERGWIHTFFSLWLLLQLHKELHSSWYHRVNSFVDILLRYSDGLPVDLHPDYVSCC